MGSDCIFCKILSGEINSKKVYEDDEFYAFEDINPQASVHTLVIPKRHISSLNETDDHTLIGKLLLVGRKVAELKGIKQSGYRSVINTGPDSGQTVFHLHLHIIGGEVINPRMA